MRVESDLHTAAEEVFFDDVSGENWYSTWEEVLQVINSPERKRFQPRNPRFGRKYRNKPLPKYTGPSNRFEGRYCSLCEGEHTEVECAGDGMFFENPDQDWEWYVNMAIEKVRTKGRKGKPEYNPHQKGLSWNSNSKGNGKGKSSYGERFNCGLFGHWASQCCEMYRGDYTGL